VKLILIVLVSVAATQLWVNREYRSELSMHPRGALVLKVSMVDVLPTLTNWGWSVRISRVLSLVMSLEVTTVLNAEL
jgi:hypothetical protein